MRAAQAGLKRHFTQTSESPFSLVARHMYGLVLRQQPRPVFIIGKIGYCWNRNIVGNGENADYQNVMFYFLHFVLFSFKEKHYHLNKYSFVVSKCFQFTFFIVE